MKLTIFWSLQNCGDGSAFPLFLTSAALAQWDQDHASSEGWGEPCEGSIEVEGDNLKCDELVDEYKYLVDNLENTDMVIDEFVKEFFDGIRPQFTVKIFDQHYYGIYLGERLISKTFAHPGDTNEEGCAKEESRVNGGIE